MKSSFLLLKAYSLLLKKKAAVLIITTVLIVLLFLSFSNRRRRALIQKYSRCVLIIVGVELSFGLVMSDVMPSILTVWFD